MWDQGSKGWDQGSEGWDLGSLPRDQGSQAIGISSCFNDQGPCCTIFVASATKIFHAFAVKNQKFGNKNGISDALCATLHPVGNRRPLPWLGINSYS